MADPVLPLAHLAIGAATGKLAQRAWGPRAGSAWYWSLGALLPDLIDKPITLWMPGAPDASRHIGHTLLLATILWSAGNHHAWARPTSYGILTHQATDLPWSYWHTWTWPLHDAAFTPGRVELGELWTRLSHPTAWATEAAAALILGLLFLDWAARRRLDHHARTLAPPLTLWRRLRRLDQQHRGPR